MSRLLDYIWTYRLLLIQKILKEGWAHIVGGHLLGISLPEAAQNIQELLVRTVLFDGILLLFSTILCLEISSYFGFCPVTLTDALQK